MLVLPRSFAHNPTAIRAPDGTFLIYHIGCGTPVGTRCADCKLGAPPLPARKLPTPVARPTNAGERLDKHLAEQRAMLDMAQRVWFSDQRKDQSHEPAWKSRRRS